MEQLCQHARLPLMTQKSASSSDLLTARFFWDAAWSCQYFNTATQSTSVLTVSPQSPLKPLHQTTHQNFHHLCINLVFFASIQRHHSHGSVLSSKSLWLRFVNSQSKGLTPALTLPFSVALSCQISGFRTLVISPAAPKSGQLCVFFFF